MSGRRGIIFTGLFTLSEIWANFTVMTSFQDLRTMTGNGALVVNGDGINLEALYCKNGLCPAIWI